MRRQSVSGLGSAQHHRRGPKRTSLSDSSVSNDHELGAGLLGFIFIEVLALLGRTSALSGGLAN